MDIIITGIQARRAQRIARQKSPTLSLVRGMQPVEPRDVCPYELIQKTVRPTLEALGVVSQSEPLQIRVFRSGAKTRRLDVKVHCTSATLPPQSFDLIIPSHSSLSYALHDGGVRIFVDGACLCVLDIIQENLSITKPKTNERKIVPFAKGLALASEFCGLFSRDPFAPDVRNASFEIEPVLHIEELRSFVRGLQNSPGQRVLRDVLSYLAERHGSPMEVMVYALAVVRSGLGGLHLPRPIVNRPLDLNKQQLEQISHERLTPDLYWKQYEEVSEYDGSVHDTPQQIKEDKRRIVDYQTLGITVFPATSVNFKSGDSIDEYMRALARHMEKHEGPALTRRMNRLFADGAHRRRRDLLGSTVRRCR